MSCFLCFSYYSEMDPYLQCLTATNAEGQPWTGDILRRELVAGGRWIRATSATRIQEGPSHPLALSQVRHRRLLK
jgi:hypothetical protein